MKEDCLAGTRYKIQYRNEPMYVIVTQKSLDISCISHDMEQNTLTGLGVISSLITLLLEEGVDKEIIASSIWAESRNKQDLADDLSMILVK